MAKEAGSQKIPTKKGEKLQEERAGQNGLSWCAAQQQIVGELESNYYRGSYRGTRCAAAQCRLNCFHAQFSSDHRGGRSGGNCWHVEEEEEDRHKLGREYIEGLEGRKLIQTVSKASLKSENGGEGEVLLLQSGDLGGDRWHPSGDEIGSL